jgi:hypothetical protein
MARVTTVKTSIINGGKTAENVTVDSTSWSTDNGTITLSAAVPAGVNVGDTITDSNTNTYLITAISGSDLTCQDFDTNTDPTTGSATIQEAYQSLSTWESELDDTILYSSGDTAQGEAYNDGGAFSSASEFLIDGGTTVGLNNVVLTVPLNERHDGTDTGTEITTTANVTMVRINRDNVEVSWFYLNLACTTGNHRAATMVAVSRVDSGFRNNIIVNNCDADSDIRYGIHMGGNILVNAFFENNIMYHGQNDPASKAPIYMARNSDTINNTVYKWSDTQGFFFVGSSTADTSKVQNNIFIENGTNFPASVTGTPDAWSHNMSSDDTADDVGATGAILNATASNLFVSTVAGSQDLHLKTGAEAVGSGINLYGVRTSLEVDINGNDRETLTKAANNSVAWDIGAHQYGTASDIIVVGSTPFNIKKMTKQKRSSGWLPGNMRPSRGIRLNREHALSQGLIGSWLLNEGTAKKIFDYSGNGYHGSSLNIESDWEVTDRGVCLHFPNLTSRYINIGDYPIYEALPKLSLSAWVKIDSTGLLHHVFGKYNFIVGAEWLLAIENNNTFGFLVSNAGGFNAAHFLNPGSPTASVGVWYHIVGTWDGSTMRLYIDGLEIGNKSNTVTTVGGAQSARIGYSTSPMSGHIMNVAIWNRDLGAGEVMQLYLNPYQMFYQPRVTNKEVKLSKGLVSVRR